MEKEHKPSARRLVSLDALRGFDMFWIMGGENIFAALATLTGWPVFEWCEIQFSGTPLRKCSWTYRSRLDVCRVNLHEYQA